MSKFVTHIGAVILLAFTTAGCEQQAKGFVLPPGDYDQGKATFTDLGCHACHSIEGVVSKLEESGDPVIEVVLGGAVTRVKTYGDLVTSIINPSHKLSRGNTPITVNEDGTSKMPYYNDVMTVQELVDVTTFLQGTYSVWVPEYNMYYYP